jgi:hypothetical protein
VHIKLFAFELPETSEAKRFARLNKASGGNNHGNPKDHNVKKRSAPDFLWRLRRKQLFSAVTPVA